VSTRFLHLSIDHSQQFRVEQHLLISRLKDVKTGYDRDLCCLEGTRKYLLEQIVAWVTNGFRQAEAIRTGSTAYLASAKRR
jgi:hypothetical protein